MHRIYIIYHTEEVSLADSLEDALGVDFFLVQQISGDKVRWFNKKELEAECKQ